MAFREDSEAARARIDALERKLAEAERENERLRAGQGRGTARLQAERSSILRRPGVWLGATAAMLATAGLIELDGGRPPWDELFPFLGAGSIASTIAAVVTKLWKTARPTELLVLSGRKHHAPDGRTVGYRVLAPGQSAFVVPIVEMAQRIDASAFPIEVAVKGVYTEGSVPVDVKVTATVAIATTQPAVERAIERFLGTGRDAVARVARETIEGATRAVLAQVPATQARTEGVLVADEIRRVAGEDLDRLGLVLLTLGLAEVS